MLKWNSIRSCAFGDWGRKEGTHQWRALVSYNDRTVISWK
jgi:hypothetical protein